MLRRFRSLLPVLLLAASASRAQAVTVVLFPSHDNTLFQNVAGNTSDGAGPTVFSGLSFGNGLRRALLKFDVASAIPPSATINSVQLVVHVTRSVSPAVPSTLHRALADWGEAGSNSGATGGAGAPAQTGDATWVFSFFSTVSWADSGGTFAPTVSGNASLAGVGAYTFNGPGMLSDVHDWLTGAKPNFGWFLNGAETVSGSAKDIASRENPDTSLCPHLIVTYNEAAGVDPGIALASRLEPPTPDPARGDVRLAYQIGARDAGAGARLLVRDVEGRLVRALPIAASGGTASVMWDGRDARGREAIGLFFVTLETRSGSQSHRLVRMR